MLVFEERGKPEYPEKNLSEQSRELTNSAHLWRRVRESNPGHIGGRRVLYHCANPARHFGGSHMWIFFAAHRKGLFHRNPIQLEHTLLLRGENQLWQSRVKIQRTEGSGFEWRTYKQFCYMNIPVKDGAYFCYCAYVLRTRDTRVSYGRYLLIQGYFCAV